jgi:two-component system, sensor histidine kinase PdtaS
VGAAMPAMPAIPASILNVEDSSAARSSVSRLLRERGFHVEEAETAADALRLIAHKPDLVLLDVSLPDGDGRDVCRQIKEQAGAVPPLVVLVSGVYLDTQDRVTGLEGGADGYLTKPVEPAELVAQLRSLLRIRQAEQQARSARAEADEARARLAAIVESSGDAIIGMTLEGQIVSWNPGAERLYGYAAAEVEGRPIAMLIPPNHADELPGIMERLRGGQRIEPYDTVRLRKDGTLVDVSLSVSPIADAAGTVTGAASIARDISERKRAEQAVRASLREKEVLLREIHHRVKNNLQMISSLLNIQAKSIHDQVAVEMLKESQSRVRSIAVIHQKLHKAKDLAHINFSDYIRDLATSLFHTYGVTAKKIALQLDVDPVMLGIETAIPCGLIINELVTNSLKYAFPGSETGTIGIALHAAGPETYTLVVRDSGGRFPRSLDVRTATSAGLQIVTALVKQLDGSLELAVDGATAFHIAFKELKYRDRQ